jgi:hypothetical protein
VAQRRQLLGIELRQPLGLGGDQPATPAGPAFARDKDALIEGRSPG